MSRSAFPLVLCSLLICGSGCLMIGGKQVTVAGKGGLAFVDLEAVSKAIGHDRDVRLALEKRQAGQDEQYQWIRTEGRKKLQSKLSEFGYQPTAEQQRILDAMEEQLQTRLEQVKAEAKVELADYRKKLDSRFRGLVQPISQRIAEQGGLSVVVSKDSDLVVSYDPQLDITNAVIDEMQVIYHKSGRVAVDVE